MAGSNWTNGDSADSDIELSSAQSLYSIWVYLLRGSVMDKIIIQGLNVKSLIGVYDWEREAKQALVIDLELSTDLSRAAKSDDVGDTIDYAALANAIEKRADESQFELLEALAAYLIEYCFTFHGVMHVKIAITKPNILPNAQAVTVELNASRQNAYGGKE